MAGGTPRFTSLLLSNLVITDTKLGTGSDANVYLAELNGTPCAAKRLHDILLEDESPGGAQRLISNFEAECITWSKLRHPGVVQFFGLHTEPSSRFPILVMERMDTSLRRYVEEHSKEEFSIHLKTFVLRQVSQALAYLHGQSPIVVHHDLSTNNILLNTQTFIAKVTDFGMSRAIQPFTFSRKSSIKGTPAFMPPEALHDPPKYNESLDAFSFGNVIISTVTHEWPHPGPPTQFEGDTLVAVTELQRRGHYTAMFSKEETTLFFPIVQQCLDNNPAKRPTSLQLLKSLQQIEASFPNGSHNVSIIAQLQQQLAAKEEECRQKDVALKEKDEVLREKNEALRAKDEALSEKDKTLKERDEALRERDAALRNRVVALEEKDEALRENVRILRHMTTVETAATDAIAAFGIYGIEVQDSWEDITHAVHQLAHKQGKEPLPDVLLQTPTSSDVVLVWGFTKHDYWEDIATHLGCSADYILNIQNTHRFFEHCRIRVLGDWLARKEGTGRKSRTWKTILEAFKKACIHSEDALSQLSSIESKLINGMEWY